MTISIPLVVVAGVLVWVAWRFMGLKTWQAIACLLLGFLLAATSSAPMIRRIVTGIVRALTATEPIREPSEGGGLMSATPARTRVNVHDVRLRADRARRAVTGITLASPAVADLCGRVSDSLADIPPMASEITGLRRDTASTRLASANLTAAGRAAIAACRDGEPDPFSYLRDELDAQGYTDPQGPA